MDFWPSPRATVVLVHGTWADGSCWRHVVPLLRAQGLDVRCVQLPLSGFDADCATLRSMLAGASDPTILVGHSYGGAIISAVGAEFEHVRSLVYVAASAPDEGEAFGSLMSMNPAAGEPATHVDDRGYLWASDLDSFADAIGRDLSREDALCLFAAQRPIHLDLVGQTGTEPAWRLRATKYLVAADDRLFSPKTQRFLAERMGASLIECAGASHMVIMSQPSPVASAILEAAGRIGDTAVSFDDGTI